MRLGNDCIYKRVTAHVEFLWRFTRLYFWRFTGIIVSFLHHSYAHSLVGLQENTPRLIFSLSVYICYFLQFYFIMLMWGFTNGRRFNPSLRHIHQHRQAWLRRLYLGPLPYMARRCKFWRTAYGCGVRKGFLADLATVLPTSTWTTLGTTEWRADRIRVLRPRE